jgi:hypothetical protein
MILIHTNGLVAAQTSFNVFIDQIRTDQFPEMKAIISVIDSTGIPIEGLTSEDILYQENQLDFQKPNISYLYEYPLDIVFVIDTSRSMSYGDSPTPFDSTILATQSVINTLLPDDQIGIIATSEDPETILSITTDKEQASRALSWLEATSDITPLNDSVMKGMELLKEQQKRKVLIVISDSKDSDLLPEFDDIIHYAQENNIVIFPITWGNASEKDFLNLAEKTGGKHISLGQEGMYPSKSLIENGFSEIQDGIKNIRMQYILTWTSSLPADGKEDLLSVIVQYLGQSITQTANFKVPTGEVLVNFPEYNDCQEVGGLIKFNPDIQSPSVPIRMEIIMDDNTPLYTDTSIPLEYEWDSSNIPPAEHNFTTIIEDANGNIGQTTICLSIIKPIKIEIVSPVGGPIDGLQQTKIVANVQASAGVAEVFFYINGLEIDSKKSEPFETNWDTINISGGQYEISVKAVDINGYEADDSINILINNRSSQNLSVMIIAILIGFGLLFIVIIASLKNRRKKARYLKQKDDFYDDFSGTLYEGNDEVYDISGQDQPLLIEKQGHHPGKEWILDKARITRLGRKKEENDILLQGATASRYHAEIEYQDDEFVIKNVKEDNPVVINNIPVNHQQILQPGDIIQAGESVFQFTR